MLKLSGTMERQKLRHALGGAIIPQDSAPIESIRTGKDGRMVCIPLNPPLSLSG